MWPYLDDGGREAGLQAGLVAGLVAGMVVELRRVGHAGQRAESVHLAHRHGNGGLPQASGYQWM